MSAVFHIDSYQPAALSIPFLVASAAVVLVTLYVLFTRGNPVLRGSLIMVCVGLLFFLLGTAAIGSTRDPVVALHLWRLAICLVPLSSCGAMLFLLGLSHQIARYRVLVAIALVSVIVAAPLCAFTDLAVSGVWKTPSGLYYFRAPLDGFSQLQVALIGGWVGVGVADTWRRIQLEPAEARRRQLRGSAIAFGLCSVGLVDVPMGYGVGWFPVSWLFLTIGVLLALRLLIADDLIRARAFDLRVPLALVYVAAAGGGVYLGMIAAGPYASPLVGALVAAGVFLVLRILLSVMQATSRRARSSSDTPLERALERWAQQVQSLHAEAAIATTTAELLDLGLGCPRARFLLPSRTDYSWESADGEPLAEQDTPDPRLLAWLVDNARPLARDELEALRLADLRVPLARLYEAHQAEIIVPLVSRDEVVALIAVASPHDGHALREEETRFLARVQEHATAAIVYARMHREATERVEVEREVGLAAAVQAAFVPGASVMRCGDLVLAGIYAPASRCGGDWWSVHKLPGGRVLVLIGDVTGHGVAAAMVTAAAKGCHDVAQRLMGEELDVVRLLQLLDASVRRAGGAELYMTCFATLVDARAGQVTFANAGHVVPYLCRAGKEGLDLDALVARGDPLGSGDRTPTYQAVRHPIARGDLLVWYTDGLVECTNPLRAQFGDRRMQRLLRRLGGPHDDVAAVRDTLLRAAVAFQEGQPPDDDITLVVGRIG
ncbi:MAG TPA: SpoIIE family protein phosphatase [Kofleriaceae bacterium]|nr:SpoIIE family protein phosphatase [Kofleriaceae bacterium]